MQKKDMVFQAHATAPAGLGSLTNLIHLLPGPCPPGPCPLALCFSPPAPLPLKGPCAVGAQVVVYMTVGFVTAKELARKSHQDAAVRFATSTKTRQYDLLRPGIGQKEPPRLGNTICYDQAWTRNSHQDSAVRFVTARSDQKEPPRPGSMICYGQRVGQKGPSRPGR